MQNVNLSLNDDGCLVVRSRAVAETYWPEKSDSLGGGIFQTSDLAELKDGEVFCADVWAIKSTWPGAKCRRKPSSAHCSRIRRCASASFLAHRAAMRNGRKSSSPSSWRMRAEMELKQFLLQTLPAWQLPREWHFVDSLSANARGKISRAEWRATFARKWT
jgi:long-chain acyl-CoA synthetase